MAKPILDKACVEQYLAKLKTDNNVKFKLSKELLTELRNNAYYRKVEEDVIDHISKSIEILNLIKIANVDPFQLCMKVFPLSLAGEARKWWINKEDGKINTWKELVKKFFSKNEGIMDDIISNDDEWEESDYENHPNTNDDSFLEPYLDGHNKNTKQRPCCNKIDELVMVYSGKRRVLNSYGHSDASSTHFCSRTQIGESSRAKYQGSSSF
ncbi:hypothetical protein Tco_0841661 [Tanacetum coccineum]|uniref:Retrotransposon gag domain-containing protein n=1 Tax=Tanacetum coccineum TaxID=301880 RepID=A0ABQ5B1E9_9ASTR